MGAVRGAAPEADQRADVRGGVRDRGLLRREIIPPTNQYTEEAENFALAVLGEAENAYGVEDAIAQMRVLDAIFRSEKSNAWENV